MKRLNVGDRVRIKRGKNRVRIKRGKNRVPNMDWLIGVEATIEKINLDRYYLTDYSLIKGITEWYYSGDMLDLVEEKQQPKFKVGDEVRIIESFINNTNHPELQRNKTYHVVQLIGEYRCIIDHEKYASRDNDKLEFVSNKNSYEKTYILVTNKEQFDVAIKFYENKFPKIKIHRSDDGRYGYVRYDENGWGYSGPMEIIDEFCEGHRNITEEVLGKKTSNYPNYPNLADLLFSEPEDHKKTPFFKKFLPFKKHTTMNIRQEIFERFLKSNKTKVIDAIEKAESIQEEISPLLMPFNGLSVELAQAKIRLENAYDEQDSKLIKEALKKLQAIEAMYDDKLFDQLKTILKAINKSLSL